TQALPPATSFAMLPMVTIAGGVFIDGRVAVPAIYPGPLLIVPSERTITAGGVATIVAEARTVGLLGDRTDFTGGALLPGAPLGHVEIRADGVLRELLGDPSRLVRCGTGLRCQADPGTPEAFAAFWQRLSTLSEWIGAELGPEATHRPIALAVLVVQPEAAQGIVPGRADWPLATPILEFGDPFDGLAGVRCGVVAGPDLVLLLPAAAAANQLTRFVDARGTERSLIVRVVLPGDARGCSAG
ncbi:MAG TPA: hypothetical protein VK194_10485, partial [Candidatus Deferrimicrobium sp.]|nr:hypothetical protein [Candidatus Deferrimicrobium sp.]